MRQNIHSSLLLLFLLAGLGSCGAGELSPAQTQILEDLREEVSAVEAEISEAEQKDRQLSGGLVKALVAARIEILKTNRALLQQRISAIEGGARLTLEVPAVEPNPEEADRLAEEIAAHQEELEAAKREADRYTGGLVQAMKLSTVATHEQTLAMLKQRYLAAKYGLAVPRQAQGSLGTGSAEAAPKPQAMSSSDSQPLVPPGSGPFGLAMGLSKQDTEAMIGGLLQPVEGAPHLYSTATVPKPHAAFEAYVLQIGSDAGLCQIRAVGADISSSSHGLQVRSAFDDLATDLSDIYGSSKTVDRLLPGSIWDEPEDWMMGLLKQERLLQAEWSSEHGSVLKSDLGDVILVARAKSTDQGYLLLQYTFTNSPECQREIQRGEREAL